MDANQMTNIDDVKELLGLIADHRITDIEIGWCLHNIFNGSDDGLKLWCNFSARDIQMYDEQTCINTWNNMQHNHYTIATLLYYAYNDDRDGFSKFMMKEDK